MILSMSLAYALPSAIFIFVLVLFPLSLLSPIKALSKKTIFSSFIFAWLLTGIALPFKSVAYYQANAYEMYLIQLFLSVITLILMGILRDRPNLTKYSKEVNFLLNRKYSITTDSRINSKFPAVLAYGELVDTARKVKMTTEECAMYIATLYLCGLIKSEGMNPHHEELYRKIKHSEEGPLLSKISKKRYSKFTKEIDKYIATYRAP
ncbi:hypothetical protein [Halotalea alkalilenta]|uniref:hypothetical protein n=1 Tax=Halotalea alkalilenta TaxID=376489 RepID=UPI001237246C|nr:hypothetical protein [Halotalea alkalilenta]